ncbi:hypothetical protein MMC15_003072 [Xylographa vitiligo]|nr:hypothetical protein [Xylographa vitiligo]
MDKLTILCKRRQLVKLVTDIPYHESFTQSSMISKKVPSENSVTFVEVQAIDILYKDSIMKKLANVLSETAVEVKQYFVPGDTSKNLLVPWVVVDGYAQEVKISKIRVWKAFEALQSLTAAYVSETDTQERRLRSQHGNDQVKEASYRFFDVWNNMIWRND